MRRDSAASLRTQLVLDLNMPGGSSIQAIPRLAMISPRTSVVVLTMEDDPAFIREALSAGVSGISHDRVVVSED